MCRSSVAASIPNPPPLVRVCVCVCWGSLGKLARVCAHCRRESGTSEAERPAGPTTQRGKLDFLRWLSDGTVGADGSLLTKA